MALTKIWPFAHNVPIVDKDTGNPTPYFNTQLQLLLEASGVFESDITTINATLATKADKAIILTAGVGLDGGGDLSADRTFDLNASLNDLNDVDTTGAASGNVLTYDGAQWEPAAPSGGGGGNAFEASNTIPLASGFTFQNQGTGTATDTSVGLNLKAPGGSVNIRFMKTNSPPASFTSFTLDIRAKSSVMTNAGGIGECIVLRNSANGRLIIFGTDNNSHRLRFQRWSAYTTFNADITAGKTFHGQAVSPWKRVVVAAGVITFYTSPDGVSWDSGGVSENVATYIGAIDEVGFGCISTASDWSYSVFNHFSAV